MSDIKLTNFRHISGESWVFESIALWRADVKETLRTSFDTSIANQKKWHERIINSDNDQYYIIEMKDIDYDSLNSWFCIGYCGLDKINWVNRNAEISLSIRQDCENKGFGKAVVRHLLKEAFGVFNLNCVYGECYTTTSNIEFWKKCGFIEDGIRRQAKFYNGTYYDSIMFSMLRQEYYDTRIL